MYLIREVVGNLHRLSYAARNSLNRKKPDKVLLAWNELGKKVIHTTTNSGTQLVIALNGQRLQDGDILQVGENNVAVVELIQEDILEIRTVSINQMVTVCYELGTRQMPIVLDGNRIILPYNKRSQTLLEEMGVSFSHIRRGVDFGRGENNI